MIVSRMPLIAPFSAMTVLLRETDPIGRKIGLQHPLLLLSGIQELQRQMIECSPTVTEFDDERPLRTLGATQRHVCVTAVAPPKHNKRRHTAREIERAKLLILPDGAKFARTPLDGPGRNDDSGSEGLEPSSTAVVEIA